MERYQARLVSSPGCIDAHMNLATALVGLGRARQARSSFAAAMALAPSDARVHRDAGIGLAALGALNEARAALARAVALDAQGVGAHLALARVCAELGDKQATRAGLERALAVAPLNASLHLEMHRALFDDRALGPAIAAARSAVNLDPAYALARLFLAGALGVEGQREAMQDALGAKGIVAPGLVDALGFALDLGPRGARYFANKRDVLQFARERARGSGPVLEFGVRHGVSTRVLAEATDLRVHAFDSFRGLPRGWQGRESGAFTTAGELPDLPANVTLHVGLFEHTLPAFVSKLERPPRLVHIDADLYESARTVLQGLAPVLTAGCVLVFDEMIGNASWRQDEHRAFVEAARAFGWRHRPLALSWITGQAAFELL